MKFSSSKLVIILLHSILFIFCPPINLRQSATVFFFVRTCLGPSWCDLCEKRKCCKKRSVCVHHDTHEAVFLEREKWEAIHHIYVPFIQFSALLLCFLFLFIIIRFCLLTRKSIKEDRQEKQKLYVWYIRNDQQSRDTCDVAC